MREHHINHFISVITVQTNSPSATVIVAPAEAWKGISAVSAGSSVVIIVIMVA